MTQDEYKRQFLQEWAAPAEPQDPLIEKRNALYERFAPRVAEAHWKRWLEQRAAIDRRFDHEHPYWRELTGQRR
jgi:hypothetical protein